jgi:hypothetical protein
VIFTGVGLARADGCAIVLAMYRTLGTRGTVFGMDSGPYAGRDRVVTFRKLSPAAKSRLVDALAGRRQLAPILRAAPTRVNLVLPATLLVAVGLSLLFARSWPMAQPLPLIAAYAAGGLALAFLANRSAHAVSYKGTRVPTGSFLFPLDLVEARRDGTLRLVPIGGVRSAAVAHEPSGRALVLTFASGEVHRFPVQREEDAERAYAALESAQQTLEKLTYGNNLADAVNLDPFFEVRLDDSWATVSPRPAVERARVAVTLGLSIALTLGLFFARNALAMRARDAERARVDREIAALEARLAERDRAKAEESARADRAPEDPLDPATREVREHNAGMGLAAYKDLAPSSEMAAFVTALVAREAKTGNGLPVYFARTIEPCAADGACDPPAEPSLTRMEGRLVSAFAEVFSQTIPRDALRVDAVRVPPGSPALLVAYTLSRAGPGPQDIRMTFDVKLIGVDQATVRTFRLTMPPPSARLTHTRDRSLFSLGDHAADADLVYARAFDRLYDELFGLFFKGLPVVPIPNEGEVDRGR